MSNIHTKINPNKINQYLIMIEHYCQKIRVEIDKGFLKDWEKYQCFDESCPKRIGEKDETTISKE